MKFEWQVKRKGESFKALLGYQFIYLTIYQTLCLWLYVFVCIYTVNNPSYASVFLYAYERECSRCSRQETQMLLYLSVVCLRVLTKCELKSVVVSLNLVRLVFT